MHRVIFKKKNMTMLAFVSENETFMHQICLMSGNAINTGNKFKYLPYIYTEPVFFKQKF